MILTDRHIIFVGLPYGPSWTFMYDPSTTTLCPFTDLSMTCVDSKFSFTDTSLETDVLNLEKSLLSQLVKLLQETARCIILFWATAQGFT